MSAQTAEPRFAFLLDLARCIGCQGCVAACKTGNEQPEGTQYIHIGEITTGVFPQVTSYVSNHRCFHCADAACVAVCPTGALFKEAGMTRLTRDACSGCAYCVDACPFDVPVMVEGLCSKCDGCAALVAAGGTPWCVKTCPSDALRYGDRETILAEAQARVAALQNRFPTARVYGATEAGGLGVVAVLPDTPEALHLPTNPAAPLAVQSWQKVVQPATMGLTGLSIIATGLSFLIARRNHLRELKALHAQEQAGAAEPAPKSEEK